MRYIWIDRIYVEVETCSDCPFYSTEYELSAECKYPERPAERGLGCRADVAPDCPLRRV